ncbi:S-adenosyl-L-methionine-dependent methyltransferase [Lineolata rhizophorae]|uniref:tRNA (guanine(26)-N(2))-dimethyltransferase n=1 Tax=Lineolata rhizophorae TaxID=578093 RepID=A0A6A6P380_9PEZI|nr:S-adenosyl-L-methionine-dependent methyltransferase [Lineolata rhizophorae]
MGSSGSQSPTIAVNSPIPLSEDPVAVDSPPKADQLVQHNEAIYKTVKEGLAYILINPDARLSVDPNAGKQGGRQASEQAVFYNEIQQFNRDLSVLAIRAYGEHVVAERKEKIEKNKQRQREVETKRARKQKQAEQRTEEPKAKHVDEASTPAGEENEMHDQRAKPKRDLHSQEYENMHGIKRLKTESVAKGDQIETNIAVAAITSAPTGKDLEQHSKPKQVRFTILDALSATGLRALRYAHELPFVTSVTANDLSAKAVRSIQLNVEHNRLEDKIRVNHANALAHMYEIATFQGPAEPEDWKHRYNVIDLDPYGTAVPFLDAALQSVEDNGLLCVTCTDAGVWASAGYLEKSFSLYGGLPMKGLHSHEGGLRLILHAIATSAARYGIAIEPLLSLSIDFYARVFVRVRRSPADVKFLAGKTMQVYNCDQGCGAWTTQFMAKNTPVEGRKGKFYKHSYAQAPTTSPHCMHCGFKTHLAGPMWGGPLHNPIFIQKILSYLPDLDPTTYPTLDRLEGMLQTAADELTLIPAMSIKPKIPSASNVNPTTTSPATIDGGLRPYLDRSDPGIADPHPFFISPSALAKVLHCSAPSVDSLKGALRHMDYKATRTHCKPGMVKTTAPWGIIWEVMRQWVEQKAPIKEGAIKSGTAGWRIMRASNRPTHPYRSDQPPSPVHEADEDQVPDPIIVENPERRREKLNIVFDEELGKDKERKRLVRYQLNPRANWGPMTRAK